ncbi:hypothetical protein CXF95_21595 [Paraglaciecola sp. MB-3u-78]|jgi:biotin transporter BioY|nr:hypothetical protein CXF95_21595 [Paraglaciecola sp. MB-3u-78]
MLDKNKKKISIAYLIVCLQGVGVIVLGGFFELLLFLGDHLNLLSYDSNFLIFTCGLLVGLAMMLFSSTKLWLKLRRRSPQV